MLKGTGVSDGYGIGKAVIIKDTSLDYSAVKYTNPDNEKGRLQDAVDKLTKKLNSIASQLTESAGAKEAEIMNAHIQMLQDPFMMSQINDMIETGCCAEAAADNVCNMFIDMFSGVDDELMRQRVSDIKDIRSDLLRTLLNIAESDISSLENGSVIIAKDLTPSMTGRINKENVCAIITEAGGITSHSAILARAMGIPAVMSVPDASSKILDGDYIIADGFTGDIIVSPTEQQLCEYSRLQKQYESEKTELKKFRHKKTLTKNGIQKHVYGNIGTPEEAQAVASSGGEGIGLFRTEFLFMDRTAEPTEEEQFNAYCKAAKALGGKEVIIRTLDIGGDKKIPYLSVEKEDNPFLGHRAIRYCLDNKQLFKRQLRAILRASVYGKLKIMLPLITCAEEVTSAKKIIEECKSELDAENIKYAEVPVGVMIETPSAAVISDILAQQADFFSIGTNDLTGYTMAVDRGNSAVSHLYDVMQISVLRLIEMTVKNAKAAGIPVGMCGESAADPRLIPKLLEWGLDEFSVSPSSILRTRKIISENNACL